MLTRGVTREITRVVRGLGRHDPILLGVCEAQELPRHGVILQQGGALWQDQIMSLSRLNRLWSQKQRISVCPRVTPAHWFILLYLITGDIFTPDAMTSEPVSNHGLVGRIAHHVNVVVLCGIERWLWLACGFNLQVGGVRAPGMHDNRQCAAVLAVGQGAEVVVLQVRVWLLINLTYSHLQKSFKKTQKNHRNNSKTPQKPLKTRQKFSIE